MKRVAINTPYKPADLNLDFDCLWGVYVGGCVDRTGETWRLWHEIHGHAHNDKLDPWFGWVCILEPKRVLTAKGRPTKILLHEIAHLLVPNQGHTKRWKRVVAELGAASEAVKYLPRLPSIKTDNKHRRYTDSSIKR